MKQHVHHLLTLEMTTLHERCFRAERHERPAGPLHIVGGADAPAHEHRRFIEVRGDERGERQEPPHDESLGIAVEQAIARRRDHHGVEHVVGEPPPGNAVGHGLDDGSRAEHARFHRDRREVVGERLELAGDELDRDRLPRPNPDRVLGRHGGDHARAEHAELVERLQVGLDAGAAARVRSRDGEGDFHVAPVPRFFAY